MNENVDQPRFSTKHRESAVADNHGIPFFSDLPYYEGLSFEEFRIIDGPPGRRDIGSFRRPEEEALQQAFDESGLLFILARDIRNADPEILCRPGQYFTLYVLISKLFCDEMAYISASMLFDDDLLHPLLFLV